MFQTKFVAFIVLLLAFMATMSMGMRFIGNGEKFGFGDDLQLNLREILEAMAGKRTQISNAYATSVMTTSSMSLH